MAILRWSRVDLGAPVGRERHNFCTFSRTVADETFRKRRFAPCTLHDRGRNVDNCSYCECRPASSFSFPWLSEWPTLSRCIPFAQEKGETRSLEFDRGAAFFAVVVFGLYILT